MNKIVKRTPHGVIFEGYRSKDGSVYWEHIKARSERHAERLARELGWHHYNGGPGRACQDVSFSQKTKRLSRRWCLDI